MTDLSRRSFLHRAGAFGAAVVLGGPAIGIQPSLASGRASPSARARALVQIHLSGGLSHLDSFDPKPTAPVEVRGDWKVIPTSIPGEYFSEHMTRTADVARHLAVIRSMTHGEADHGRGTHSMLTGYAPSPAIVYPSLGAVISHELPTLSALPPYIVVPQADEPLLGTGYLSTRFGPFSVGDEPRNSNFKVRDLEAAAGIDAERQMRRRKLLSQLDGEDQAKAKADALTAMDAFYDQAWKLIDSPEARTAFDIRKEPQNLRNRYGMTPIGQRLLLARRLVASGARCVTVIDRGYDHHENLFQGLKTRLVDLDKAFAAFIEDMQTTGLLDSTVVVLGSEFGRTSKLNATGGRDHWPKVFSVVVAGGGVHPGQVFGASDAYGAEPADHPVSPADLAATIFSQLGIDPRRRLLSDGGRPVDIVRDGRVLRELVG